MLRALRGVSLLTCEDGKAAKKSSMYFPSRVQRIPSAVTTERYHQKNKFSMLLTPSVPGEVNEGFESRSVVQVSLHIFMQFPLKL